MNGISPAQIRAMIAPLRDDNDDSRAWADARYTVDLHGVEWLNQLLDEVDYLRAKVAAGLAVIAAAAPDAGPRTMAAETVCAAAADVRAKQAAPDAEYVPAVDALDAALARWRSLTRQPNPNHEG